MNFYFFIFSIILNSKRRILLPKFVFVNLYKFQQDQKESDDKKLEEIRKKMEANEIIANSLKEQAIEIFNTKAKEKETKKTKNTEDKHIRNEDDLGLNEDEDRNNYSSDKDREQTQKKEKKRVRNLIFILKIQNKF